MEVKPGKKRKKKSKKKFKITDKPMPKAERFNLIGEQVLELEPTTFEEVEFDFPLVEKP